MIKNCLFAVALLSLTLAGGCAKGGNGMGSGISVTITNNITSIYPNQGFTFTAKVTGTTNQSVNWSLTGTQCTGSPNACGTLDSTSGAYTAPPSPPSPANFSVTATSAADSTATASQTVQVVQVTVVVTPIGIPTAVSVGQNLTQQFTAVAIPDDAPQTFTWTCTPTGSCGSVVPDQNSSNTAVYTAPASNGSVVVAATWNPPVPPTQPSVGQAKVTVASSRLSSGTYAFRFAGYDSNGDPVAAAGSFILASNGTVQAGIEDLLTSGGPQQYQISSVQYSPTSNNNDLGTLTVSLSGGPTNTYTAVLTSTGIIRMIESGGAGKGSGVMQKSAANTVFNAGAQTFVFGFTGVDKATGGNRVGYVGLLPLNNGNISGGLLDPNDNGTTTSVCGAPPCNVAGTYFQPDASLPTWWHMTLTSGTTLEFDFFVSAGQTNNQPNPLTLYAISTDATDATHPELSGSMVYQFPVTYNNAAFAGTSVSNLTGANANVSLTLGTTDGSSSGTGGTGGFTGTFDQNNNGVITSVGSTAPFSYTYVASSGNVGRYIFQMLEKPNTTPVQPLPFVLYASGANRGFLLDQSSSAVMTGTMDPQPAKESGSYSPSALPGAFAAATTSNSSSSIAPLVQNLVLSWSGTGVDVTGVQNPGNHTLTGTLNDKNNNNTFFDTGVGTVTLTAPSAATYAMYAIDATAVPNSSFYVITDFMMIGTTSGTPSSIIFAQE